MDRSGKHPVGGRPLEHSNDSFHVSVDGGTGSASVNQFLANGLELIGTKFEGRCRCVDFLDWFERKLASMLFGRRPGTVVALGVAEIVTNDHRHRQLICRGSK